MVRNYLLPPLWARRDGLGSDDFRPVHSAGMPGVNSPVGSSVTVAELTESPYGILARLQTEEPVSWVPALGAWMVTDRDLAIEVMRDPGRFTVDDPRFSTAAVLGPSMLSLEGPEHERHRAVFANHFRPRVVRDQFEAWLGFEANRLVAEFAVDGKAELRTKLAGPLAVNTIIRFLGLSNVEPQEVLVWYHHIAEAIVGFSLGEPVGFEAERAIATLKDRVARALEGTQESALFDDLKTSGFLGPHEIVTESAVVMFGAIETSEGMTANVLWHLLTNPETLNEVAADRSLVGAAVEESLRLEPAAAVIDRYTTADVVCGDVTIPRGQLVTLSLLAANRDPHVFDCPEKFDISRPNLEQHVTFVQGPHGCLGLHLARLETVAVVNAVLDQCTEISLISHASSPPEGLIFRKPASVFAEWG